MFPDDNIKYVNVEGLKKITKMTTEQVHEFLRAYLGTLYEASMENGDAPNRSLEYIKDHYWMFAVTDGMSPVIAGACGYKHAMMSGQDWTLIEYLYIRKAYQRHGIGSEFLNVLETNSKRIGLIPEDESAERFYHKKGYAQITNTSVWVKTS